MVHVASAGGRHKMLAFQPSEPLLNTVDRVDTIITVNTTELSSNSSSSSPSPSSSNTSEPVLSTEVHRELHIIAEEPAASIITQTNHSNVTNGKPKREKMNQNQDGSNGNANYLVDSLNSNHNMNKQIMNDGLQLISHGLTDSVCESLKLLDNENENNDENKVFTEEIVITSKKTMKTGIMKTTSHSHASSHTGQFSKPEEWQKHDYIMEEGSINESNDSEDIPLLPSGDSSCEAVAAIPNQLDHDPAEPSHNTPVNKLGKLGNCKQVGSKRVSFGSSKGSMVETLVYENPIPEEKQKVSKTGQVSNLVTKSVSSAEEENASNDSVGGSTGGSRPPSRVRVTFFESEKPLAVSSPESDIIDFDLSNMTLPGSPSAVDHTPTYNRQMSEGWDNPFRPEGDLSKEADQIVELIKEGKPITEENLRSKSPSMNDSYQNQLNASPRGKENGTANGGDPGTVQHGVVAPAAQAGQVEHVVLKKKKGCCVIQ